MNTLSEKWHCFDSIHLCFDIGFFFWVRCLFSEKRSAKVFHSTHKCLFRIAIRQTNIQFQKNICQHWEHTDAYIIHTYMHACIYLAYLTIRTVYVCICMYIMFGFWFDNFWLMRCRFSRYRKRSMVVKINQYCFLFPIRRAEKWVMCVCVCV